MPMRTDRTGPLIKLTKAKFVCGSVFVTLIALATSCAQADAFVVTRAMSAPTIAEFFVEDDHLRIELEVGPESLPAFRSILPRELADRLSDEAVTSQPLESAGITVWNDGGEALSAVVKQLAIRPRTLRDEITGQPKADRTESAQQVPTERIPAEKVLAEEVLYAELEVPFDDRRPTQLTFAPPRTNEGASAATVGFVVYHKGLPVNDFRYLAGKQTLDLNWEDPWYSQFENKNLRRQNAAPMSAFLYVEPFEVRKEIIIRPKDLQAFVDLGLSERDVIRVEDQPRLKELVAEFLEDKNPVTIDGVVAEGTLDRMHFIRRSLRQTGIIDPPEALDATSATLGVIYVYPIEALPDEVAMTWELFPENGRAVPAAATDEAGPLPSTLTPSDPELRWKNYLKNPSVPKLAVIPPPPRDRVSVALIVVLVVYAIVGLSLVVLRSRKPQPPHSAYIAVGLATVFLANSVFAYIAVSKPYTERHPLAETEAREIVGGLLHNVYRAFDRRDPSLIYDQLATGIAGDLLEQVYLETRAGIEIENQGGLKIAVDEVEILRLAEAKSDSTRGHTYLCTWRVSGSVGHWGHTHMRENTPSARIVLAPVDQTWKIVDMDLVHERAEDVSADQRDG